MKSNTIKRFMAILLSLTLIISLSACGGGNGDDKGADIVIKNAAVFTADADNNVVTAVAVKDGVIAYAGDDAGVEEFVSDKTEVIDLEGGSVIPGITDSHMHPAMSAVVYYYEITLQDVVGEEAYLKKIEEFVKEQPDLEAYAGSGFMRSAFDEVGPRKEALDKICPDKPMMITSADGHSTWVNSKALELAGITAESKDPEGGVIQRDPATGEPAGLLQESASNLVADLKPVYTKDQYKEALLWLQEWFGSVGITTIYDALVPLDNEAYYMAYQELAEEGKLTLRVRGAWSLAPEMGDEAALNKLIDKGIELSKEFTTPYFQINSFKFFADQVLEEQTAYMSEGYSNRTDGWKGIKVWDDELLTNLFTKIDKAGFQIHIHQIGDEAATYALDALEKMVAANGERDSRHTLAHVQFLKDSDAKRIADLKMNAIIAPYWSVADDYYWDLYVPYIGEERANNMYPAKSLMEAGINTAIHSDFFVTEPDPGWLFYSAVTRTLPEKIFDSWFEGEDLTRTKDYNVPLKDYLIGPLPQKEECMTIEDAIKAATYNGAYANFMEKETGSIEVGKKADLIMYDGNLLEMDIEDVSNIQVSKTIFDGKIIFSEGK